MILYLETEKKRQLSESLNIFSKNAKYFHISEELEKSQAFWLTESEGFSPGFLKAIYRNKEIPIFETIPGKK